MNSSIKCFMCLGKSHIASKCPIKKPMILRDKDHYSSQEKATSSSSTSSGSEEEG
uniref:CCHC-type domain-containing protein n=1 Tax=Cajanus cajan TaxID=3821 RepID=A0A151RIH4_CAJCA|nr:hypothetical protein KK1_036247 [Cajanus cajan]